MIHVAHPEADLHRNASLPTASHRRLMVAVLRTALDDCRGSPSRQTAGEPTPTARRTFRQARAYVASTDRVWPFSFENLCEALSLDVCRVRRQFRVEASPGHTSRPSP